MSLECTLYRLFCALDWYIVDKQRFVVRIVNLCIALLLIVCVSVTVTYMMMMLVMMMAILLNPMITPIIPRMIDAVI